MKGEQLPEQTLVSWQMLWNAFLINHFHLSHLLSLSTVNGSVLLLLWPE